MTGAAADISVVVCAHSEGLLLKVALAALERAIVCAQSDGRTVETVLVLDRADEATRAAAANSHARKVETDFGDPAPARVAGIAASTGRAIAIADGDDLFSETWLRDADRRLRQNPKLVLHPELNLIFGEERMLFAHSAQADVLRADLLEANFWTGLAYAARETFDRAPYLDTRARPGFGYEDWHWNCETVAAEFVHEPVAGTLHAIRRKGSASRRAGHEAGAATFPPTQLFAQVLAEPPGVARAARSTLLARALRRARREWQRRTAGAQLPEFARAEVVALSALEPALRGWTPDAIYRPIDDVTGALRLLPLLDRALGSGAAIDTVILSDDGWAPVVGEVLCLGVEPAQRREGCRYVSLPRILGAALEPEALRRLLLRWLIERAPRRIVAAGIELGWWLAADHGQALSARSALEGAWPGSAIDRLSREQVARALTAMAALRLPPGTQPDELARRYGVKQPRPA